MPAYQKPVCENVRTNVLARLKRIEGQVRGLQNMVETGRSCEEIIMQLASVKAAVVNAAMTVLGGEMVHCLGLDGREDMDEALEHFMKVFKKFS